MYTNEYQNWLGKQAEKADQSAKKKQAVLNCIRLQKLQNDLAILEDRVNKGNGHFGDKLTRDRLQREIAMLQETQESDTKTAAEVQEENKLRAMTRLQKEAYLQSQKEEVQAKENEISRLQAEKEAEENDMTAFLEREKILQGKINRYKEVYRH